MQPLKFFKKKICWCPFGKCSLNAHVYRDIENITFSSYATSPNDNFSGKMWFGLFFFLRQASVCSDCRSAASSCASIGSLCLQKKLIRTYCLWQTLCIFQPVLAFVKSEKRRRPRLCLWWSKTDGIHTRAVLCFNGQYSNPKVPNCKIMCETPIRYP